METQHILAVVGVIITVGIAWSGFLVAVIKFLLDRSLALQDEKINALTVEVKRLNEEQAALLAQLPTVYIRKDDCRASREDWVREITALEHKVSGLVERINTKLDALLKEVYDRYAGHERN